MTTIIVGMISVIAVLVLCLTVVEGIRETRMRQWMQKNVRGPWSF